MVNERSTIINTRDNNWINLKNCLCDKKIIKSDKPLFLKFYFGNQNISDFVIKPEIDQLRYHHTTQYYRQRVMKTKQKKKEISKLILRDNNAIDCNVFFRVLFLVCAKKIII